MRQRSQVCKECKATFHTRCLPMFPLSTFLCAVLASAAQRYAVRARTPCEQTAAGDKIRETAARRAPSSGMRASAASPAAHLTPARAATAPHVQWPDAWSVTKSRTPAAYPAAPSVPLWSLPPRTGEHLRCSWGTYEATTGRRGGPPWLLASAPP